MAAEPWRAFDPRWFARHHAILIRLLAAPLVGRWFRRILCIRSSDVGYRRPIVALYPHAYVVANADGSRTIDVRTHPKYAKRIYRAGRPLWWTLHAWDWAIAEPWAPDLSFGFPSLTTNPNPATSVDGHVLRGTGGTLTALRTGAGTAADAAIDTCTIRIDTEGSPNYNNLYRAIVLFNTAPIGAGAIVQAATLAIYINGKNVQLTTPPTYDVYTATPASNTALVAADYQNVGSISQTGAPLPASAMIVGGYVAFPFNATGRGNVAPTGISKFSLRIANYDADGTEPAHVAFQAGSVGFWSSEASGTATDPKLDVTYTTGIPLNGTAAIVLAAAGSSLQIPAPLAAAAPIAITVGAALLTVSGPLLANAPIRVTAAATLTAPTGFRATAAIRWTATITVAQPLESTATPIVWTATATINRSPRGTAAGIAIGGVDVRGRVRMRGLTIHDVLNDAPSTCALVIDGEAPAVGQPLRITLGDETPPRVLFAGTIQTVEESYEAGKPQFLAWAVNAIDDTARANARRPFGTWADVSATTIALELVAACAPAFSPAGIAPNLPPVSIVLDGADTVIAALTRLASLVGGYCKIEDGTIFLFTVDAERPPDPLTAGTRFLNAPPIAIHTDTSQVRTRVYGKGYGEHLRSDVLAGETLLPIENGAPFPELGGEAIAGVTADGAQSERLTFTSVELGGGGTLIGPGAAPANAPLLALAGGAGVDSGRHSVAVVFLTASGPTLPGPAAAIDVGAVAPPETAPTIDVAQPGTGPDQGTHEYVVSYATSFGETLPGPVSNAQTTSAAVGQLPTPSAPVTLTPTAGAGLDDGVYDYRVTFVNAAGETAMSVQSNGFLVSAPNSQQPIAGIQTGPAGTTARRLYRGHGSGNPAHYLFLTTISGNTQTTYTDTAKDSSLGAPGPTSNTTGTAVQKLPIANIPIGPPGTTARKLYRRFNGAGAFRLAATIGNNTATTYPDTTSNAALGANAPTVNTAIGNQIALTAIPVGAGAVTAREIYMTRVGDPTLRRALVIANNTATTGTITASDATLAGAPAAPSADLSGLTQPPGQVNPGSTVIPLASAATFRSAGGWASLAGEQTVRYTGIVGQALVGIPASGPGAIETTVLYGSQALPAPMLVGVVGVDVALHKGAAVHLWIQRDDLLAQAEQAARDGSDGIIEYLLTDARRGVDSLTARCDADLAMFARPIITVSYATRDTKTKSGKPIAIDLAAPRLTATLTIQDVTITEIDMVPNVAPRFTVRASSVRFSLADTLRRLISAESKTQRL